MEERYARIRQFPLASAFKFESVKYFSVRSCWNALPLNPQDNLSRPEQRGHAETINILKTSCGTRHFLFQGQRYLLEGDALRPAQFQVGTKYADFYQVGYLCNCTASRVLLQITKLTLMIYLVAFLQLLQIVTWSQGMWPLCGHFSWSDTLHVSAITYGKRVVVKNGHPKRSRVTMRVDYVLKNIALY